MSGDIQILLVGKKTTFAISLIRKLKLSALVQLVIRQFLEFPVVFPKNPFFSLVYSERLIVVSVADLD